jgi:hypothetical protein
VRHVPAIALVLLIATVTLAGDVPVAPRETGPSADSNLAPYIVASGNEFVAIWSGPAQPRFARFRHSDEILLTGDFGRPGHVEAAVAGPNGAAIAALSDAEGIRIATIARDGEVHVSDIVSTSFSSMAWNGSALLVITRDGDTILTDARGRVLHHGAQLILDNGGISSASARGSGFAVTWATVNDIFVTTLLGNGQVAKEQKIADRQIGVSAIGCNPSGTCLLLSAQREPLSGQILGDTPGPLFRISQDLAGEAIAPVWDGKRFLVVSNEPLFGELGPDASVQVAAVSLDGTVTPVTTIASPARDLRRPAIAHANGETVVGWMDSSRCGWAGNQIVARSLITNHDLRFTNGLATQLAPAIAAGGTDALIAWTERGGESRVRARLFPFTEPAFDISSATAAEAPVVASDGSGGYLVAWRESLPDESCRTALRVRALGSDAVHTLGKDIDAVQVTWNGSEYVVLWEQTDPAQLFAVRVDRSGQAIDPAPIALTDAEKEPSGFTSIDHEPAGLFRTGDGYLLVWRRSQQTYIPFYPDPPPQFDIRATRLGPQLFAAGAPQILGPGYYVAAAMKGNTVVALWKNSGSTLHAIRLSATGAVLEDRDLGVTVDPTRLIATRSGYAIQTYYEILFLDDALSLVGRRPLPEPATAIAETPGGLAEVYAREDTLFLSWPDRRRRALR